MIKMNPSLLALLNGCAEQQKDEKLLEDVSYFETVIVMPITAARIREASPDENFAGKSLYLGASADGIDIALLQYNVSSLEGKPIEKALLRFDARQTCHSSYVLTYPKCGIDLVVEAHEIEHPWTPQTVTWNSFENAYNPTVLGTAVLNVPEGKHFQYTIDITPAVRNLVLGKQNYDIALVADEKGRRKGRFQQTDTVLAEAPELVVYLK